MNKHLRLTGTVNCRSCDFVGTSITYKKYKDENPNLSEEEFYALASKDFFAVESMVVGKIDFVSVKCPRCGKKMRFIELHEVVVDDDINAPKQISFNK